MTPNPQESSLNPIYPQDHASSLRRRDQQRRHDAGEDIPVTAYAWPALAEWLQDHPTGAEWLSAWCEGWAKGAIVQATGLGEGAEK